MTMMVHRLRTTNNRRVNAGIGPFPCESKPDY
jgi:hypothetical protein